MATIVMSVSERRCMAPPGLELVTHNPIDSIQFDFDAEWIEHPARTARFAWHGGFIDVPFIGDTVQVPEIQGTLTLYIGVYADGISSTPAKVPCNLSVKAYGGPQKVPTLSVYDEIIALVSAGIPVYFEDLTEEQKAELVAEFSDDVAALQALTGEGPLTTTAQTLAGGVNELEGRADTANAAIQALNTLAGEGPIATTAQTLAGGINELNARADTLQTAIGGFSFALDSTDGGLNIIYTYE